uniref:Tubulin tyrosine ligase-like family, member 3 n=1 Tax=Periophthalmus magnuspinnatus TaxID=409849 RepID=A0A3B4BJ87_9GOBI
PRLAPCLPPCLPPGPPGPSSLPGLRLDRIRAAKALVERAVKLHKIFSVQGPYPVIREALRSRGWVEKRLPRPLHKSTQSQGPGEDEGEEGENGADGAVNPRLCFLFILCQARMVRNETTYFYWTTRRDAIDCHALRKDQMINHYENAATFTTKVGLCVNLRNLQWFDSADPDTFFPRCYVLGAEDEKHAFIVDFRRTACTSLLQHVVETHNTETPQTEREHAQTDPLQVKNTCRIGPSIIETALRVCHEFLIDLDHGNIDRNTETSQCAEEQQWAEFLREYYLVVHDGAEIRNSALFLQPCAQMLQKLRHVCPQLDTDGVNNIWIIKPGAKSRGRGIICLNRLDDIMALVDRDRAMLRDSRWVVQKYLERPLLVHHTKFDVRQWFLVTDWNPLTVWFYGECYLRFSTQPYSTKNLHSSVHLCNNSIQKHFQPSKDRHPDLPEDNMWSCAQFRSFLSGQGREEQWESVVVPGMRQAVVRALQTAQDSVVHRRASFELYGADFMLGRDLRPWLLEINASPTMCCSTGVTSRLCPAVQTDTLRVVLDRRNNAHANTGGFQLIYKQPAVDVPQYMGVNLLIEGASIRRHRPQLKPPAPAPSKPLVQKSHTLAVMVQSNKENRTEKRRQLLPPELPLVAHTEPQRKARRLGHGSPTATLVPQSLSFSFNPSRAPRTRTTPNPSTCHRFTLPPAALDRRQLFSLPYEQSVAINKQNEHKV